MSAGSILSWMACGLMVGLVALLLVSGRQSMGLLVTVGLAMVGAVAGGALYSFAQGAPGDPFSLSGTAWHGWVVAVVGAAAVLWAYLALRPSRWSQ